MNATMTVEASKANSHAKLGWSELSDAIIKIINKECTNVVFMLWGAFAQKKGKGINKVYKRLIIVDYKTKHLVLESVHPSPLSAHRGFIGNGHFSKSNAYLIENGKTGIDWNVITK